MSEFQKLAAELGDNWLSGLAESQEQFLKSLQPFTQWNASMPQQGFAQRLPTPQEIIESNFALASKLLHQQQEFARKVIATSTPGV